MGYTQVLPGVDFRPPYRLGLPELCVPAITEGLESVFAGAKMYNGSIMEPQAPDGLKDLQPTAFASQTNNAAVVTSAAINNQQALYFKNDSTAGRTKSLFGPINITGNKMSMSFTFVNQSTVDLTVTRILFFLNMTDGKTLSLETSGLNSKMAIVINGVRTELLTAPTLQTAIKIRIEYNVDNLKIYVNNVLDSTFTGLTFTNFIGTRYIASNAAGNTSSRFHGYFCVLYTYFRNLTDAEGTIVHNSMVSAFA